MKRCLTLYLPWSNALYHQQLALDFKNQILKVILLIFTYSPLVDFNGDDIYDFEPIYEYLHLSRQL